MKVYTALLMCLIMLLCGCSAAPETDQPETGGEPLAITAFSFCHTTSYTGGCYCLELTREESGTRVHAEELFSGGRIVDTVIENSVLEQLGELAGTYRVDRWDGFDKSSKRVSDGSTFSLAITLADGSTVSAHGNNSFPKNYSEVSSAILALYNELMEQHAPSEDDLDTEGSGTP